MLNSDTRFTLKSGLRPAKINPRRKPFSRFCFSAEKKQNLHRRKIKSERFVLLNSKPIFFNVSEWWGRCVSFLALAVPLEIMDFFTKYMIIGMRFYENVLKSDVFLKKLLLSAIKTRLRRASFFRIKIKQASNFQKSIKRTLQQI